MKGFMNYMDIGYVKAREALIPLAEQYANKVAGRNRRVSSDPKTFADKWNRAFHSKMERLWRGKTS